MRQEGWHPDDVREALFWKFYREERRKMVGRRKPMTDVQIVRCAREARRRAVAAALGETG